MTWRAKAISARPCLHGRLETDVLDVLRLHEVQVVGRVLVALVAPPLVHAVLGALLLHAEVELVRVAVRRRGGGSREQRLADVEWTKHHNRGPPMLAHTFVPRSGVPESRMSVGASI